MKYISLLFIVILFGCNHSGDLKYPRVVKNGCGKYAVIIKETKTSDGVLYSSFIGVQNRNGWIISGWTVGGQESLYDKIIREKTEAIWNAGDTQYNYLLGYEMQFADSISAQLAANSYVHRQNLEKSFRDSISGAKIAYEDSIKKCHTYK